MSRHIIYRQKIVLNLSDRREAIALQEKVSRLMKNELADSLERTLDQAFPPDKIVRIDTLQLDLGGISLQNFESEFKAGFIEALTKSLAAKSETFRHTPQSADKKEELLSKPQSLKEALLFFLQKGRLPWYSPEWKIDEWETEILNNFSDEEYRSLIKWLTDKCTETPVVIDRLVYQFSDKFIESLLVKIRPAFEEQWPRIFQDFLLIINSLLKPAGGMKERVGEVVENIEQKEISAEFHHIREKIWQFTLRVWLNTGAKQPVAKILELLLAYFGISRKHRDKAGERNTVKGIRTMIVKDAFGTIFSEINVPEDQAGIAEDTIAEDGKDAGSNKKAKTGKEIEAEGKRADILSSFDDDVAANAIASESDDQAAAQAFLKKPSKKDQPPATNGNQANPGDLITANNCGVVLLNPFLKKYFEDLGLTQKNAFVNEAARGRAVLLLNYLATGESKAPEYDLALQKILCGYPADETLMASIRLTKKEKAESEALLKAIMEYWEPLHNTSVAGFRESFLRRAGNLELRESGWLLKVEQKTLDILLGKLPWGFSTIRLPWMKDLLSVDWY